MALLSPAVLPFLDASGDSPLNGVCSLRVSHLLAKRLPLIFPLPRPLHATVSSNYAEVFKTARINDKNLSETVIQLNAEWDGLAKELALWLQQRPAGLTTLAAEHLKKIPQTSSKEMMRMAELFSPSVKPDHKWNGINNCTDWCGQYSSYLRNAFYRREPPETWKDDPAKGFSDWIQRETATVYNNTDYGFVKASRLVKEALANKRTVLFCMLDAFAYHLEDVATKIVSKHLKQQPTFHSCMFAPVPTITEIGKRAILSGYAPNKCSGSLEKNLLQAYSLDTEELLIANQWKDIERVQPSATHRLIVYQDNRIDAALSSQQNYSALRNETELIMKDISVRLQQWSEDLKHINGTLPLIILTADHGFTYGSPASKDGETSASVGHHRCRELKTEPTKKITGHAVYLHDKDYFLPKPYLAVTSRTFGHDTISGWVMQHGGLLPEEVLVPLLVWHGDEKQVHFAQVSLPVEMTHASDGWSVSVQLRNTTSIKITDLNIKLRVQGQDAVLLAVHSLRSNEVRKVELILPDTSFDDDEENKRIIVVDQSVSDRKKPSAVIRVGIKRNLVESSAESDAFESMF